MIELNGKTALITGGSRGIGRAVALRLAESGADIVVNYVRHKKDAEAVAEQVEKLGRSCLVVRANVSDATSVENMFTEIKERFGKVDIVVSNAASGVQRPIMEITEHHWDWAMETNARALLTLVQKGVPMMAPGSRIMAISSLGAIRGIENYTVVGASKAALESLVRHLAVELGSKGINVNTISAGVVDTDALKHFPNREQIIDISLQKTPMGRLTTPEDVADMALFLASDLSSMVQGQVLIVDGGFAVCG